MAPATDPSPPRRPPLAQITTIPYRAVHIACGNNYTFMVADDGKTWGWGDNRHGQLGLGTMSLSEDGRTTEFAPPATPGRAMAAPK